MGEDHPDLAAYFPMRPPYRRIFDGAINQSMDR